VVVCPFQANSTESVLFNAAFRILNTKLGRVFEEVADPKFTEVALEVTVSKKLSTLMTAAYPVASRWY